MLYHFTIFCTPSICCQTFSRVALYTLSVFILRISFTITSRRLDNRRQCQDLIGSFNIHKGSCCLSKGKSWIAASVAIKPSDIVSLVTWCILLSVYCAIVSKMSFFSPAVKLLAVLAYCHRMNIVCTDWGTVLPCFYPSVECPSNCMFWNIRFRDTNANDFCSGNVLNHTLLMSLFYAQSFSVLRLDCCFNKS